MIVPFVWWQSRYDYRMHAFPVAQVAGVDRHFYEAACGHSVTPATVIRKQQGTVCLACALVVGSRLPDPGPGRTT